jgi:hypothetical protein
LDDERENDVGPCKCDVWITAERVWNG